MAFGIGRIVKAVENLSKQVTGNSVELSAAIAQSGSDLGTALNDIRHVSEANSREIAAVRRELAELCALVESRRTEAAEVRAASVPAETGTEFETYPFDDGLHPGDDQPHHDLLAHAAGVANAELVCHADTWAFIAERASRGEHFRMPVDITADVGDGTVEVRFSGRTLIAIADALWEVTQAPGIPPGTHHLAAQTYNRIHGAVADAGPTRKGGVVRIVIDDRTPADPDVASTDGSLRLGCTTS